MLSPNSIAVRIATITALAAAEHMSRFNLTPNQEYLDEITRLKGLLDDPGVLITTGALHDARLIELSFRVAMVEYMSSSNFLDLNVEIYRVAEEVKAGAKPDPTSVRMALACCRDVVRRYDQYHAETTRASALCDQIAAYCDSNIRLDMDRYHRFWSCLKQTLEAATEGIAAVDKKYAVYKENHTWIQSYHDKYVLR